ncbi:TBC1 domain family member 2B-like isoform X2 [Dreissena polymorpha]|uniref:TBC1 domain family member 2B-like isoform X2 n=1 Tax=Dreissena polymorpha TaxID=45954 RepID=UPI002263AED3|nr:TBC1 domain family member 2B-like isoform X2 [Dreissena polymorpha]
MEEGGVKQELLPDKLVFPVLKENDNAQSGNDSLSNTILDQIDPRQGDTTLSKSGSEEKDSKCNQEINLSGWLKYRTKTIGGLKSTWQHRWFEFSDETCKLYFYRDPLDLASLGEISIATASFDFDASNVERQGIFQIKADGKDYFLDASTRKNMFYWLQTLQMKRREFNLSRHCVSSNSLVHRRKKKTSNIGGLLSKDMGSTSMAYEPVIDMTSDFPEICVPDGDPDSSQSSLSSLPGASGRDKSSLWPLMSITKRWGFTGRQRDENQNTSSFYCELHPDLHNDHLSVSTSSLESTESNSISSQGFSTGDKIRSSSQISNLSVESDSKNYPITPSVKLPTSADLTSVAETDGKKMEAGSKTSWVIVDNTPETVTYNNNSAINSKQKNEGQKGENSKAKKFLTSLTRKIKPVSTNAGYQLQTGTSTAMQKDVADLEEELKANREIITLLQENLSRLTYEQQLSNCIATATEDEKAAMILEQSERTQALSKEKKVLEEITNSLQDQLAESKSQCAELEKKISSVELELKASHEQVSMYDEMLHAKNDIIKALRDQLDSENKERIKYKDMCLGYELQHKFLTKEILELNDLRKDDLAREQKLTMDNAKLRAKYYQIKSKYFVVLKQQKEQSPLRGAGLEEGQEVVTQLLHDALEFDTDDHEMRLTGSLEEYDRYGFSRKHYMDEAEDWEEDSLGNKAAVLERQSEELSTQVKDADHNASLRVKWENYMVGRGGKLQKSVELKNLIRQGVPHLYREEVWKGCIQLHVGDIQEKNGDGYYQALLQRKAQSRGLDLAMKQIELDLLRTLPNNRHYESIESEGILKLRRVLLAFSEYNRLIGYCQGLNRLAAIALLFLNEEDAFWCLVAIVEHILPPEYFSTTLMAAQADQRVLKDLVKDKLPSVHQKLEANQVDLSLFTFNWFLTVFVDNIPTEMFLRIWDTFLYEGSKVLFRFATAFLKHCETEILQQQDGLDLNRLLRKIGEKMTNVNQISYYAFNWINPFSMRFLANKRQQHMQDIKMELTELDKLRKSIKREKSVRRQEEYLSEDDLDS